MKKVIILWKFALCLVVCVGMASGASDNSHQPPAAHHNHNGHSTQDHKPTESTIKLSIKKIEDRGSRKLVQIQLTNINTGKAINPEDLKETHTQKMHLLIIDDGLEDYSHIHPTPLNDAGVYEFEWSPKKQANYRIWADLWPLATNAQEYVIADLISDQKAPSEINRNISMESSTDGYTAKLSFNTNNLTVEKAAMGKVVFTDSDGNPVKYLEPIMGAYAHIVGFSEDMKTIVHIHPMGIEPSQISDRGGPDLQFHTEPTNPGFIKLFAQVQIKGKELFFPFGIIVK